VVPLPRSGIKVRVERFLGASGIKKFDCRSCGLSILFPEPGQHH
jgi:hypothetical protein